MYKRPILMLMVLGSLMILVGTGFTASDKPVDAAKAGSCNAAAVNYETGQACTPAEMEACKAACEAAGKTCTPEEMEACEAQCRSGKANATGISGVNAKTISSKAGSCATGKAARSTGSACYVTQAAKNSSTKVNAVTVNSKSSTAKQCDSKPDGQPKGCCDSKDSI